ncbi:unnamed protein product [Acanthosepion pharaonis]|uniref:Uncharacterized protein n=1 Tax=Acanthosepion pharaonis TaxID=158019 RepID=A0A812BP37_ACAPH|nr:unnamed protein product [Sepia pharaonis]
MQDNSLLITQSVSSLKSIRVRYSSPKLVTVLQIFLHTPPYSHYIVLISLSFCLSFLHTFFFFLFPFFPFFFPSLFFPSFFFFFFLFSFFLTFFFLPFFYIIFFISFTTFHSLLFSHSFQFSFSYLITADNSCLLSLLSFSFSFLSPSLSLSFFLSLFLSFVLFFLSFFLSFFLFLSFVLSFFLSCSHSYTLYLSRLVSTPLLRFETLLFRLLINILFFYLNPKHLNILNSHSLFSLNSVFICPFLCIFVCLSFLLTFLLFYTLFSFFLFFLSFFLSFFLLLTYLSFEHILVQIN